MKILSYSLKDYEIIVEKQHNVFVVNKFKIGNTEKVESIKTPSLDIAMELFSDMLGELKSKDETNGN